MASSEAIAESRNGVVSSDCISYSQSLFSHPIYKLVPAFPNNFGAPINLGTSQIPVVVNISPEVINLNHFLMNFTVNLPAGAGATYTWYHQQALSCISHIQFYTSNQQWVVDLDQVQNYLDIVIKRELEATDFQSLDLSLVGTGPSNSPVNVLPALRNSNLGSTNVNNNPINPSNINYLEPAYFNCGALNGIVSFNVQFPLRLLKHTAFEVDKNLYFGGQTSYFKVYFGPLSKICYLSTSNASPSAGTKTPYVAAAGSATITNFVVYMAVEQNQDLRALTMNRVMSPAGLNYIIPYVQSFKNSNNGTSQNINIQIDAGSGKSLVRTYHAIYNSQEDLDTAYDHANTPTIGGVTDTVATGLVNQKLGSYYTMLNSKRNQDITIDCTPNGGFLDYMQHKRQFRKSILMNRDIMQYNWCHVDDFAMFGNEYDQAGKTDLLAGIPLVNGTTLTWGFVGVSLRPVVGATLNNSFQHYTYFVLTKKLSLLPAQVIVE